jgi:hypothetical protein
MTPRPSRSLEISVRIYRMLLGAYPASFRRQYGDEMAEVFREMAEEAVRRRGALALVPLWLRILPDLAWTVGTQQIAETERRVAMWRQFWGRAHFPAALTLALLVAALATPADPASMVIAAVPIFGVYVAGLASRGLGPPGRALVTLVGILHAVLWIGVISFPAVLLVRVHLTPLTATGAFLVFAALAFLTCVTTAALVGIVAMLSRGGVGARGPNEDAEIVA